MTRARAQAIEGETALPSRSRLTPERESALFATVLELLAESGYEALTMDAVAHRAHTSKATIYRQWLGKPGLVAAAIRAIKEEHEVPDTGTLRGDLVSVAEGIGKVAEKNAQLFAALGHAIRSDLELAAALQECVFQPYEEAFQSLMARAVARGELRESNPAISFAPGLFLQAIVSRPILEGKSVDTAYLLEVVDCLMLPALGIAPVKPSPQPTSRRKS